MLAALFIAPTGQVGIIGGIGANEPANVLLSGIVFGIG